MFWKKKKLFKERIKGLFDDWKIDNYHAIKDGYSLWIASGFYFFKDDRGKPFLTCLKRWEKKLIWKELTRHCRITALPKAKPKKKKE